MNALFGAKNFQNIICSKIVTQNAHIYWENNCCHMKANLPTKVDFIVAETKLKI